jgi:hypothetical protein
MSAESVSFCCFIHPHEIRKTAILLAVESRAATVEPIICALPSDGEKTGAPVLDVDARSLRHGAVTASSHDRFVREQTTGTGSGSA